MNLEEIEKRLAKIPRNLEAKETHVPRMIRDRSTGTMIECPRGGSAQSRIDVIDLDDPDQRPWIHFHIYRDHPLYIPDSKSIAESVAQLVKDAHDLISEIKKLKGENHGSRR